MLKNREILKSVLEAGALQITKAELKLKGYNFIYLTHHLKSENNLTFIFCFEYGFSISNEILTIKKYDGIF